MVSLWLWKGDDTSPASFEKTLSALSSKISKSQLLLDSLRQRSRRFKALWTLYTSFAYLLCTLILGLVVGWRNWGALEYSALAGSPLIIYLGRTTLDTYYLYRINSISNRLEEQQTERAKTIEKLKAATKYNSTQQLLEKYGGESPKSSPKPKAQKNPSTPKGSQKSSGRTSLGPPATANIPQNRPPSQPSTPQPMHNSSRIPPSLPNSLAPGPSAGPPEFAPNAFSSVPQYDTSDLTSDGNWYDRILDLLLGDDETSSKNRVVLICKHCRLVNGQAPPGVKRLEELGKWRCIGCGVWNGEEDEGAKVVEEIKERMSQGQLERTDSDKDDNERKVVAAVDMKDEDDGDAEEEGYVDADQGEVDDEQASKKLRRGRSKKERAS